MLFHISSYSLIYLAAAAATALAAALAWKRRWVPGGMWLFLMILAAIEWTLADFMDVSSYGLAVKTLWGKISYFGSSSLAVFLLLFALEYTQRGKWITRRKVLLLMIVPALSWVVAFSNDWHHLLWSSFSYVSDTINVLIYAHGPLYWVITAYIYAVILAATWFLIGFAFRNSELYRLQSIGILTATLIPYLGELVYDFAPGALLGLDTSAIALSISGIILTFSLTRARGARNPGRAAPGRRDRAGCSRPGGGPEPGSSQIIRRKRTSLDRATSPQAVIARLRPGRRGRLGIPAGGHAQPGPAALSRNQAGQPFPSLRRQGR